MVNVFLEEVLCWKKDKPGTFGHTSGFYATVEQQGRLTLHLHGLIWVRGALSPQAIRDRLTSKDSVFTARLVAYLESSHQGGFIHGSVETVRAKVKADPEAEELMQGHPKYKVPTQTFPEAPPPLCTTERCGSQYADCVKLSQWWLKYEHEIDDLLLRSNIHSCCLSKEGVCKARFPRDVIENTFLDEDGHVNLKHLERNMNTVSRIVTYFSRCNTDVTSLLSGTAVKAVISYVADYVSKLGLKSYQAFASVFDVFDK
ncbi:hypothetical protein B0H17DRAFT_914878, partial [Mycena rosella]